MRSTMHGFYSPATADTRLRQVRHVAEPLGNGIYAFQGPDPIRSARESASQRHHNQAVDSVRRSPPEPQGLETDSF